MIICLTGLPGSGKSTAATIIAEMGFDVLEISWIIKEEMKKKGLEVTTASLEAYANKMKLDHGKGVFAKMMGERLKDAGDANILVVGFRSVAEFETVEKNMGSNLPLIMLEAPQKLRFKRLHDREELPIDSIEELIMRDNSNIHMGIMELFKLAEYVISNTGTEDDLRKAILDTLKEIGEQE